MFCGKYVDENAVGWVRVVDGGSRFATPGEEVDPQGDIGCWPVGKTCHKKYGPDLVFVEISKEDP